MQHFECAACKTTHRTEAQYKKHLASSVHTHGHRATHKQYDWYVNRVGKNEGVFIQVKIEDLGWVPSFKTAQTPTQTLIQLFLSKEDVLQLEVEKQRIDHLRTFEHFCSEVSIYTIQIMFLLG
ncbi:hypothetical protein NEDG_01052 [Nematocida displodere]|uniref:C2H2-type domain-containing protein n=1 Tax=Nematocida displodere TaxID=1805483 RepID=A0A177EAF2_9MICR|nr:hypothetical protein NEDG_01052 [Nematocida displodere]